MEDHLGRIWTNILATVTAEEAVKKAAEMAPEGLSVADVDLALARWSDAPHSWGRTVATDFLLDRRLRAKETVHG